MDKIQNPLTTLESLMEDRFGRYSKYIIQERALPDVRDGLKPVQRRILYAMHEDNNTFDKAYRKSAKTVGLVIGNYHPHGDSSVYEAMVRMSQTWKMNIPLIDMQGNNGSIDDDPAAAMRYTEARLSKFCSHLLEDISQFTVKFSSNFDDTSKEPVVLPTRVPQLLVNGVSGIAAGYATNIPSHNLIEIIDATILRLEKPLCQLSEIESIILGPDFPTGGIVQGKSGIHDAFSSGKGKIVIRAKVLINTTKTVNTLTITEIPFEVIKSNLVKKMDDIRLNKSIEGLIDVRDESDRTGLKIVLEVKKEIDPQLILNYLYKNTELQIYYNYNMVAIVDKRPILCGLMDILDHFIGFRKEVVLKRSKALLDELENKVHILLGLIKAISVLDEVIAIIRQSKDKMDAKINLIKRFEFSEIQAEAIVTLRLYRLTNTDVMELKQELNQLHIDIDYLKSIIAQSEVLKSVLIQELLAIKQMYPMLRKTKIENEVQEIIIDKMSMIPNERVYITISKDGYIKRVSQRSYLASDHSEISLKEGDQLIGELEVDTYDTLLLFTNKGYYASIPVYSIEDARWKDIGNHYGHYLKSQDHETVVAAFIVKNFDTEAYITLVSEQGFIKKTLISDFNISRTSKTYEAMILQKNDQIISCFALYRTDEVAIVSKNAYGVIYTFDMISLTQPKARGVKAMNLVENDTIASACALNKSANALCVICVSGQMKRIKLSELNRFNRPARGEALAKRVKSNPQVVLTCTSLSSHDVLKLTHHQKAWLNASDVAIMDKDASFSQVSSNQNLYLVKEVEEIRQVEFLLEPVKEEKEHSDEDVEFIHFDI